MVSMAGLIGIEIKKIVICCGTPGTTSRNPRLPHHPSWEPMTQQ
jgi:hypothetical protein